MCGGSGGTSGSVTTWRTTGEVALLQMHLPRVPVRRRARVGSDDRVLRQDLRQLERDALRVHLVELLERALLVDLPPALDAVLDLVAPGAVLLADQVRDQRL